MPSKPLKAIRPMFVRDKWRIVRGDIVQIIAGKDKGQTGKVIRVIRDKRFPRVVVEDKNMVTKHVRKDVESGRPGFAVRMEAPLHYSNVMLLDPVENKPVRTSYRLLQIGDEVTKSRWPRGKYATKGKTIPRPKPPTFTPSGKVGEKDTTQEVAQAPTYNKDQDFLPSYLPRALREHVPHIPQGLRSYYSMTRPSGTIFNSSSSSSQQADGGHPSQHQSGGGSSSHSSSSSSSWFGHLLPQPGSLLCRRPAFLALR